MIPAFFFFFCTSEPTEHCLTLANLHVDYVIFLLKKNSLSHSNCILFPPLLQDRMALLIKFQGLPLSEQCDACQKFYNLVAFQKFVIKLNSFINVFTHFRSLYQV